MDSSAVSARLIGAIFVEKGLITDEQLELALEQQRATGDRIGEILVEEFGIERLDLASALAEQWAEYERQGHAEERERQAEHQDHMGGSNEVRIPDTPPLTPPAGKRPIGEIFVERGLVNDDQLEEALTQQRETGARLGEILVASGKLSRLELASALADQWASFQKLRPPAELPPEQAANGDVLPTPEVVIPAPAVPAVSVELAGRVDALAARIDQLAVDKTDWKPQLEKTAELLRSRMEHIEEIMSRHAEAEPGVGTDEVRGEIARLAARIETIPVPSDEWRSELAQVAENLRTRVQRVEAADLVEQIAELRTALEHMATRVDALPEPGAGWREAVADLGARIESLPVPSEEWRQAISDLSGRIDAMPAPSESWHEAVAELGARIESLPVPSEEWRQAIADLSGRIDALPAPGESWHEAVAELRARIDALPAPSDDWREAVADLRGSITELRGADSGDTELRQLLEALTTRVDELATPSSDWNDEIAAVRDQLERIRNAGVERAGELRTSLADLSARIDEVGTPADEWRGPLADLSVRIDSLATPDQLRSELAEVAENLRLRIERVEHSTGGAQDVDALRAALGDLSARIDVLPVPSDEWRGAVSELAARIDSLTTPDQLRSELAEVADNLRSRVDRVEQGMAEHARPAAVTQIAEQVDALARKLEGIDTLDDRFHALAARIEALPEAPESVREELAALAARIDALPVPSEEWRGQVADLSARVDGLRADGWRPELAQLEDGLRARIEQIGRELGTAAQGDRVETLAARLDELAAHVDGLPGTAADVRAELAQQVEIFSGRVSQLEHRVSNKAGRELFEPLSARIDELTAKAGDMSATEGLSTRIDELAAQVADRSLLDALARRVDELAGRRDVNELDAALTPRIAEMEGALTELRAGLAAIPSSVDARVTVAEALANAASAQATSDVETLRGELHDLHGAIEAVGDASAHRVGELAATLDGKVANLDERFAARDAVAELRSTVEQHAERVEGLGGELVAFERHVEQKAVGRSAELGALRARLEAVENALQGATGWSEAVEGTRATIESLEVRLIETSAAEADERNAEIEGLRADVSARIEALEGTQVTPRDLRDLRDIIEVVERRADDRAEHDEAGRRALEDSVRVGLKGLGKKLSASGEAYLETSRDLTRSLAGLELAVVAAESGHLEAPRATNRPSETTVFLAFAPTGDGYRLVECEGTPPELNGTMTVDGHDGELVATRIGVSPLPFDTRPCIYLERRS